MLQDNYVRMNIIHRYIVNCKKDYRIEYFISLAYIWLNEYSFKVGH